MSISSIVSFSKNCFNFRCVIKLCHFLTRYLYFCVSFLYDLCMIDMEMDARDMSFFPDKSFDAVVDKGTLDSLMCGSDAPISSVKMLGEVSRLLKPGGIYMLITYGDPKVRMPHLTRSIYNWKIILYIIPRPGFEKPGGSSSNSHLEPVPISDTGVLPADFVLEDPDSHFIYVCKKMDETTEVSDIPSYPLIADAL
ncbi:hypothetical protein H0E87_017731 [Populus deltoides]|uniref:Methyltransferase type 11 domain-containing protein n=1 Tax=Populus deltoides TaxID=3696 RepID=A0A8T2Y1E7_POPDE|nr:hypothetical protein H0E87_017731 [Populus deltoides]